MVEETHVRLKQIVVVAKKVVDITNLLSATLDNLSNPILHFLRLRKLENSRLDRKTDRHISERILLIYSSILYYIAILYLKMAALFATRQGRYSTQATENKENAHAATRAKWPFKTAMRSMACAGSIPATSNSNLTSLPPSANSILSARVFITKIPSPTVESPEGSEPN